MAKFRDTHFVLQKVQTHKTNMLVYKKLDAILSNSECLDYSELTNILRRDVKSEDFGKIKKMKYSWKYIG